MPSVTLAIVVTFAIFALAIIKINYKRVLLVSVSERRELRIFETSLRRDGRIKKKTIQPGEDC